METKIKIQIKNRWTGSILFEYEKENNTIKDTVVKAVKSDADLRGAYLRGADLCGADLCGAYLRDAYLRGADLCGADLCGADLRGADLCGADLCGADLCGAYLGGAYLGGANLRDAYLCGADLRDAKELPYIKCKGDDITEEKQLLLKELCARLPYGVIVQFEGWNPEKLSEVDLNTNVYNGMGGLPLPYLRPMSSMTEEERLVYEQRFHDVGRSIDVIDADDVASHIDWLLCHHFDFRGLIYLGLALEAPEDMYKTE